MTAHPDLRGLCAELAKKLQEKHAFLCRIEGDDCSEHPLVARALAALEAVPAARTSAPNESQIAALFDKHKSLFAYDGSAVAWDDFKDAINEVFAAYGTPAPVPVAKRPWEREGWLDEEGQCWFWDCVESRWIYRAWEQWSMVEVTHSLPYWAFPIPEAQS